MEVSAATPMDADIDQIIINEVALARRVQALGEEIARTYAGNADGITIVPIMSGSIIFLADLMRYLPMMMKVHLVTVSSYRGKATAPEQARLIMDQPLEVEGCDVLIVDDILDTGGTLRLVKSELSESNPRSVKTAVLLRKPSKKPPDVDADYVGFDIEDEFVVGYGLDYDGLYRNLPYVGVLKPEMYENP